MVNLWPWNGSNLLSLWITILPSVSFYFSLTFLNLGSLYSSFCPSWTHQAQNMIISKLLIVLRPLPGIELMYYRPQSREDDKEKKFVGFSMASSHYCIWQDAAHITQSCQRSDWRPCRCLSRHWPVLSSAGGLWKGTTATWRHGLPASWFFPSLFSFFFFTPHILLCLGEKLALHQWDFCFF